MAAVFGMCNKNVTWEKIKEEIFKKLNVEEKRETTTIAGIQEESSPSCS